MLTNPNLYTQDAISIFLTHGLNSFPFIDVSIVQIKR